jgi:23S rRNA (guanosine2251-2'-O)-methyltransferase
VDEYQFRQCTWEECRFRSPVHIETPRANRCPVCGSDTYQVGIPASGKDEEDNSLVRPTFEGLLDNIRSIHNVGSMFRTADGAGIKHLYLCGMTATPANTKLTKAALGAQEKVAWSYHTNALDTAVVLKERGYKLWAIEAASGSTPFFSGNPSLPHSRIVVIVGNEKAGVDPGVLDICDEIFKLPMHGFKKSLNVAVAFGIVAYHLRFGAPYKADDF